MLPEKIILIGFMGGGKTTVAALLGAELKYHVIELDELICTQFKLRYGRQLTVQEIFLEFGEQEFRLIEREVTQSTSSAKNAVVSTGGGVGADRQLLRILRQGVSTVIFLKCSFSSSVGRLENTLTTRPLLQNKDEAEALYRARLPIYTEVAEFTVETDLISASEVCDAILAQLRGS